MYCEIIDIQQWDPTSYWVRLKKLSEPKGLLEQMYPPVCIYEPIEDNCYTLHTNTSLHLGKHIYVQPLTKLTNQFLEQLINQL